MRARPVFVFALSLVLSLMACVEEPVFPCPDAATSLQGACAPLGLRCQWPTPDPTFVTYCTCAGTGASGTWTCADFRRVDPDAGLCPSSLPSNGERCDWPTARPCVITTVGCVHRCECTPMVGVLTPPQWQCLTTCASDAGLRDVPRGG